MIRLILLSLLALANAADKAETQNDAPQTLEQQDFPYGSPLGMGPMAAMGGMGMMGNSFGMRAMGTDTVSFDFQCKCQAKSNLPKNMQVPTDANQAAQQQINQLNEQIRRLNEQLRRTQQGQSTFEQFAQILSMADGLDCNCSGSSAPFNNFPFGDGNGVNGMSGMSGQMGGMSFMPRGSAVMGQRMFPGMMAAGMFP